MGLEDEVKIAEPAVDRWSAAHAGLGRTNENEGSDARLFSLSGGIMRQRVKTSNKIDGLLSRMMEHPEAGKYLPFIDRNLDYLFTSLQLDMITMAAEKCEEERLERREEP
jgi:hypothetical protein